jgi:hypothetical protein
LDSSLITPLSGRIQNVYRFDSSWLDPFSDLLPHTRRAEDRTHRCVGSLSLLALLLKSCTDLIVLSHILSRIARQPVGAVAGLLFLAHHGVWLSTELILPGRILSQIDCHLLLPLSSIRPNTSACGFSPRFSVEDDCHH